MIRKKFKIFMAVFIVVSTAILSGFMINNLHDRKRSNSQNNQNSIVTEGTADSSNTEEEETAEEISFYLNESAAKKTKMTSNEITTFVLETKLFITNETSKVVAIDPDAFALNYDTEGTGLLFSIEYGNIEKPILIEGNQTTAINFVVKYIIQDVANFNDYQKHELIVKYMNEVVLTANV